MKRNLVVSHLSFKQEYKLSLAGSPAVLGWQGQQQDSSSHARVVISGLLSLCSGARLLEC